MYYLIQKKFFVLVRIIYSNVLRFFFFLSYKLYKLIQYSTSKANACSETYCTLELVTYHALWILPISLLIALSLSLNVQILNDMTGNLDAKKACTGAMKLHKKYLKKVFTHNNFL